MKTLILILILISSTQIFTEGYYDHIKPTGTVYIGKPYDFVYQITKCNRHPFIIIMVYITRYGCEKVIIEEERIAYLHYNENNRSYQTDTLHYQWTVPELELGMWYVYAKIRQPNEDYEDTDNNSGFKVEKDTTSIKKTTWGGIKKMHMKKEE